MEEQNSNLSPEERNNMLEQRRQRLKAMGLPTPVTPIVPSGVGNIKDPGMLKRIQEIRSGTHKKEFKEFENKANGKPDFQEIPVQQPKQKPGTPTQPQNKIHVPLEEFSAQRDPNIDALDRMFDFDGNNRGGNNRQQTVNGLKEDFNSQIEDGGKNFSNDFRNKFHNRLREKEQQLGENAQVNSYSQHVTMPAIQSGMIILNEEDLKKKIIEIAKPIAKQVATEVIKQVLTEYAKGKTGVTQKPVVSETKSNNTATAVILPNGKVKIGNKVFNLSPDK